MTDHIQQRCLLLHFGLCDMFDGKIARTKERTERRKKCFGIQIDSLADIVCFGILPIVLGFKRNVSYLQE